MDHHRTTEVQRAWLKKTRAAQRSEHGKNGFVLFIASLLAFLLMSCHAGSSVSITALRPTDVRTDDASLFAFPLLFSK
jgi:hypothetical protein